MSVSELIDEGLQKIPDSYYEKKNRLIKFPTYGDSGRIAQKLQLIAEVHEEYDELLPEDELLTLDILESVMNFSLLEKGPKTEEIFEDVFLQAQKKKTFLLNDLLVIHYYFLEIHRNKYIDEKLLGQLERKLLVQEISSEEVYDILLITTLMDIATIHMLKDDYKPILQFVNRVLQIADEAQLHTYKPIATTMKAKYFNHYEHNMEKAEQYYDEAMAFAKLLGDDVLAQGIKQEKADDGL
ncbi:Transcriptional regulator [Streptococcus sp. DD12]|nr:Transcriptional regulator [Streptococcus sp. DD12]